MRDIFESRSASPMLLNTSEPFDSEKHVFELKLDGIRCLVYSDGESITLRNRKNNDMTAAFPEFSALNERIKGRAILDGEIVCLIDGKPDFYALLSRLPNMGRNKAVFTAFDVLYYNGEVTTGKVLEERKELLSKIVSENECISVARFTETSGMDFFSRVKEMGLEGIVAKRKGSLYHMGKRSSDWLKMKCLKEEEFFICGFTAYPDDMPKDLILGVLNDAGIMEFRGKVFLGISPEARKRVSELKKSCLAEKAPFKSDIDAFWLKPKVKCLVEFSERTESGLRQPVFRGFAEENFVGKE